MKNDEQISDEYDGGFGIRFSGQSTEASYHASESAAESGSPLKEMIVALTVNRGFAISTASSSSCDLQKFFGFGSTTRL